MRWFETICNDNIIPYYHFLHKDIHTDSRRFQLQINSENIQKFFNQGNVNWGRIIYESHVPPTLLPGILFLPPFLCLSSLNNLPQYVKCLTLKSFSEQFQNYYWNVQSPHSWWNPFATDWKHCVWKLFRLCSLQHREGLNSQPTCTGSLSHWIVSYCLVNIIC